MGFADSFKKVIGIEEIDEEEVVTEEEISAAKEKLKKDNVELAREKTSDTTYVPKATRPEAVERKTMTTTMPDRRYSTTGTSSLKLLVIEPRNFEECKTLVDNLKAKKPIIVNLEKLETELARRIFDFLSGAVYSLNGTVTRVTNNIFIFAPANVGISESKDSGETVRAEEQSPWR